MSARLSSADTAWLHMDRPTNLMVINSVDLLDQPLDWDRVKEITQTRLVDCYPRFRQRVVESRVPLRAPRWEDDPDFSLEHHMHHLALPTPGDAAALQKLVGDLMTQPLPPRKGRVRRCDHPSAGLRPGRLSVVGPHRDERQHPQLSGEVTVGLRVDAALVPDPGEVVVQFEREVRALSRPAARQSTRSRSAPGVSRPTTAQAARARRPQA
jgi:hypothetical protein